MWFLAINHLSASMKSKFYEKRSLVIFCGQKNPPFKLVGMLGVIQIEFVLFSEITIWKPILNSQVPNTLSCPNCMFCSKNFLPRRRWQPRVTQLCLRVKKAGCSVQVNVKREGKSWKWETRVCAGAEIFQLENLGKWLWTYVKIPSEVTILVKLYQNVSQHGHDWEERGKWGCSDLTQLTNLNSQYFRQ